MYPLHIVQHCSTLLHYVSTSVSQYRILVFFTEHYHIFLCIVYLLTKMLCCKLNCNFFFRLMFVYRNGCWNFIFLLTVRRALQYPKYEYRLIMNIVFAPKYNCYFGLGKDFSVKVRGRTLQKIEVYIYIKTHINFFVKRLIQFSITLFSNRNPNVYLLSYINRLIWACIDHYHIWGNLS